MVLKSKKIKALTAGIMLTLAMGLLGGCGSDKKEAGVKKVNVGIVQMVEHEALDAANKGFVDGMAAKGFRKVRMLFMIVKMLRLTSLICRILPIVL